MKQYTNNITAINQLNVQQSVAVEILIHLKITELQNTLNECCRIIEEITNLVSKGDLK